MGRRCMLVATYPPRTSNKLTSIFRLSRYWDHLAQGLQKPVQQSDEIGNALVTYWLWRRLHPLDEEEDDYKEGSSSCLKSPEVMKYADIDMQEIPRQMSPLTQVQNNRHSLQDRSHWRIRHSESINNNSGKECPEVIDLDGEDLPVKEKTETPLTVNGVTTTVKKVSWPWQDKKPSDDAGFTAVTIKVEREDPEEPSDDYLISKDNLSSAVAETEESDGSKVSEGGTFIKKKLIVDENRQLIKRTGRNRKEVNASKKLKEDRRLIELVAFRIQGERKRPCPTVTEDSIPKRPKISEITEKEPTSVTEKCKVNGLSRQNSKDGGVSVVDLVEEEEEEEIAENEKELSTEKENKTEVIDPENLVTTGNEVTPATNKSLDSSIQPKEPVISSSSVIAVVTNKTNVIMSSPSPLPAEEKRIKSLSSAISAGVPNRLLSQMPSIEVKKVKLCPSLEKKATAMSAADSLTVIPSVTITKTSAGSSSVQSPVSINTSLAGLASTQVTSKLSSVESSKELLKECETIISGTNLENKVGLNPAHSLTRKLVKKLTRAELESFLLEMTCDLIFTKSDAGKYRQMYEEMKESSENKTAKIAHLSKQIADLTSVVNRAIIECKEKKGHMPLRLTRSVGLQLDPNNIMNAYKARARGDKFHVIMPSSKSFIATTPPSVQDRMQPQRWNRSMVSSTSKAMPPPSLNGVVTRPASKGTTPTASMVNRPPQRQLRALHPRASTNTTQGNGLTAAPTPTSAQSVSTSESPTKSRAFVNITERSKINNLGSSINIRRQKPGVSSGTPTSNTGNTNVNSNPMPPNHVLAPTLKVVQQHYGQSGNVYSQPGGTTRVVTTATIPAGTTRVVTTATIPAGTTVSGSRLTYLIPSSTAVPVPQRQVLLASATAPQIRGRPANTSGNTLQTMLMRPNTIVQLPSGAITTSSPTLMRTVPTNSQQQIMAKNSQQQHASRVLALQSRPAPSTRVILHHPAPLPAQPQPTVVNPNLKPIPRRPVLKLSKVPNGIVLSWNMTMTTPHEEIASYQLYAYQEGAHAPPSPSLWKKVGDVKALPLPMACTLTQFADGHTYHFAVRAVDVHGRVGEFSVPGTIELFN